MVDEPSVHETVSPVVSEYKIKAGTTVYDAMVGLASSIDFTFQIQYRNDKRIHITPILIQDYTDYLKGSKYEGLGFQTKISTNVVNHLISTAIDKDTGEIYRIHFFADENGGIQPYATVDFPIKDSQYILDKRNQVLFGIDEIAEYEESSASAEENYELLTATPSDWSTNFGSYYYHEFDETGNESWNEYEAVGEDVPTAVTTQPSDWATNYSSYYIRTRDEQTLEYTYTNVSAESVVDKSTATKQSSKPSDWSSNYNEYYYKFQTGDKTSFPPDGIEYRNYDGVEKSNFHKLTTKPDDWDENFGSYYRKVFKKETKTEKGKTKILVDYVKVNGEYYTTCKPDDDKKDGKIPSFSKRTHYRQETYTVPPTFLKNNCYTVKKVEVAPVFDPVAHLYFRLTMEYHAPEYVNGTVYQKVFDHYAPMVEDAIQFFEAKKKKSSQGMELENFVVNIGDVVGGTDEFTKTAVVGNITNIEAKIKNGLIEVAYSITVEDYTTDMSASRQADREE